MDWTNILIALLGAVSGGGVVGLITALLQRHWKKQDEAEKISPERIDAMETKLDAIVKCQKVMSVDRIRHLGLTYIENKSITLEEKETLHEMHDAYEGLGGNGHLDTLINEVDKLEIIPNRKEVLS